MSGLAARYAVCEGVLRQGSFADDVELVAAAGIAGIGVAHEAVDGVGAEEAARILDGEGVRASSYMTLEDILQGEGTAASLDEAARRLDVAAQLGAPTVLVGTGPLPSLSLSDAEARSREWLVEAAPLARERNVRIMLEPMHPLMRRWSFVHTMRDALALTDGIEGVGVVLDLGHVWWEHDLDSLIRDHVEDIATVQLTNIDSAALEEIRYERAPLDQGDVRLGEIVTQLEAAGYAGWYENEVLARIPRDERLGMLRASREWLETCAT